MYIAVICLVLYGIVYCLIFFSAYYEVAINLTSQKEMNVCQNALVCALETINFKTSEMGRTVFLCQLYYISHRMTGILVILVFGNLV